MTETKENIDQTGQHESGSPIHALFVLIAATLWGCSGLLIRIAAVDSTTIAFFRMIVPTVVLGGFFLVTRHRLSRDNLSIRLAASTINAVRMYFYFLAFQYTTVANAVVALYSWPIFAAWLGTMILHEPVSRRQKALLALAFLGVPILYLHGIGSGGTPDPNDIIGITSMIVSAMMHALSVILLRRGQGTTSPVETTFFQNLVGSVVFTVIFLMNPVQVEWYRLAAGLGLGVFPGTIGFSLLFLGMKHLKAATASNLAYFEVVVAVIIGTTVLKEPLHVNTIVGGALIVVSLLLVQRPTRFGSRLAQRSQ